MTENIKTGTWNPSRVLEALDRIGYAPAAAILDIVDNAISAQASKVCVKLELEKATPSGAGRPRKVVHGVSIVDNGIGMDEAALDNAISLGSSDSTYSDSTLSKYGIGLKSASASLGRRCTIVSRPAGGAVMTAVLDHDQVASRGEYVYELRAASPSEVKILDEVCLGEQGTLVRITKIVDNLPSPAEILENLKKQAGVTYYYALIGEVDGYPNLQLEINGDTVVAVDPLFESEITSGKEGDLDERTWDGCSVKYITRRQPIQLNSDGSVSGYLTITQLPHPPSLSHHTDQSRNTVHKKYMIGPGNYGFYVYRNGRLITWAESLGLVSQHTGLYSFRGRLEITTGADDILNLDVTKSRIKLSEIAETQLKPRGSEAIKKSRAAFNQAKETLSRLTTSYPHSQINEALDRVAELEEKEDRIDESIELEQEQNRRRKRREQITDKRRASEEEGRRVKTDSERVQYVDVLENNQLWQRAHHPEYGLIVRVNRSHRMFHELLEPQFTNPELVKAFDLFFYSLARGEYDLVYKSNEDENKMESLMDEYRERVGVQLSEIIRQLDIQELFNN